MVRFSCFPAHMHCHRPKKVVQHSMQEKCSQEICKDSSKSSVDGTLNVIPLSTPSILKDNSVPPSTNIEQITSTSSLECCQKSEELNAISYSRDENEIIRSMSIKKSHSLGSGLDRGGRFPYDVNTDDEIDQGSPLDNSKDNRFGSGRGVNSFDNSGTAEVCGCKDPGIDLLNQNQEHMFEINTDPAFNESICSIEDIRQLDNDFYEYHGQELPSDGVVELGHMHAQTSRTFSKSCSLPKLGAYESSSACRILGHRSRSVGNLCDAGVKTEFFDGQGGCNSGELFNQCMEASSCHDMSESSDVIEKRLHSETDFGEHCVAFSTSKEYKETPDKEKDLTTREEHHDCVNEFNDENTTHNFATSVNDWREPITDSIGYGNVQEEESLAEPWHELDSEDFNVKRIKEWIRQIDVDNSIVQEVGESSNDIPNMGKDSHLIISAHTSKPNVKEGGGVKAAYNYISSLSPACTSAQMANLGLVVIPFLSAFTGLRVLNLSGNAIVRITSGALPRALHMLNLSRNNISIIEGFRELSRLRVLDLSYNRIFRIGHGLAACSSLKELYLAGNKISEVEGLHRLLKLNILDLRFNKISTVKSLGQLAANYDSLQAINLEGNPAQRNVGDDQLKRYLHSLLPRLIYFNKHIIRNNSTKEASDRSTRSAASHQYDRGMRSDHKHSRRGHTTTSSHKVTSSSNHFRVSPAVGSSSKQPRHRDQHAHLPSPESIANQLPKTSNKLFSRLQTINTIRRSQSEGNL